MLRELQRPAHGPGSRMRRWLAVIAGATALTAPVFAAPALAQETSRVDNSVIIVTAQRRSEALEDVPMSVAVLSGDALQSAGVTSLRDIQAVTTGIQLGQGGAFPQPSVRGVTTVINGTFENNVAVYVDGIYQVNPQTINIDLPNIASVQVLKGPQGTLYGRNATGGAILLETITPSDWWQGEASATYARFDDKRISGYVAGPVSDRVGISLSGYMRRSDGYMKLASRTTPGETDGNAAPLKQDSIRAKLKLGLTDTFTATLAYNYTRVSDGRGNMFTTFENVPPTFLLPGGELQPNRLGVAAYDIGTEVTTKQHEGSLTLQLDTSVGVLKSITGYTQTRARTSFDFDGSYIPLSWSTSRIQNRTFQQALDFTVTAIDRVDLIVGGTYFRDRTKYIDPNQFYLGPAVFGAPYDPANPPGLDSYVKFFEADFAQTKEAWAVYADATFHATDALSLNIGGRYSEETQDPWAVQTSISPTSTRPETSAHAKFSKFTPRASIRYEVAPRTNIYASYSKGFRSGAFNSTLPGCLLTDPTCYRPARQETIDAYEIGFKTAGATLRAEVAAFYYDYKNLQVSSTVTLADGSTFVDVTNAPKAKIKGIEASLELEPIENLKIRAGAIYLHARYGSGFTFSGTGVSNSPAEGGGVGVNTNSDPLKTYLNVSQVQDLSGLQMSRAPDFSANIGVDYFVPIGEGGVLYAANLKYTDSYVVTNPGIWGDGAGVPADRQREQRYREGKYALFNASVTWTDPTDTYYVRVFGTNLSDHRYRLHYSGTTSYGTYSPMAEPRTYGVTIGYKFDGGS
ncbi:TonB-dependent receptor [Novosphingobium indicum]|nr:TonB-dependent receptor [Novosphingobium indicum]